ncbi:unnamed protein product [Lymnaea stagnalis]|uniref:Ig-like domain-containing protein n=1 Tax=Lymnaea stagnalis TaxID=6523 RepID=A0AAV2IPA7_LYMST
MKRSLQVPTLCAFLVAALLANDDGSARAGDVALSQASTPDQDTHSYQTYITLYKDAVNEINSINCTVAPNATLPPTNDTGRLEWVAPQGVKIVTRREKDQKSPTRPDQGKLPWVELTAQKTLVFHDPDASVSGQYVCRRYSMGKVIYQTTVFVHLVTKSKFDENERIKIALIATAAVICSGLLCFGAYYWYKKNKCTYGKPETPKKGRNTFIIPTINVVDMSEVDIMLEDCEEKGENPNTKVENSEVILGNSEVKICIQT